MTSGISGPGGPKGPGGTDAAEGATEIAPAGAALTAEVERLRAAREVGGPSAVDDLDQLAADLDAGRVTGDEALARLVAGMGIDLGELDGAELRSMLADLIASDPYLAELAAKLGATGAGGGGEP